MTAEQLNRLNYIIGRIEGIGCVASREIGDALLDTVEMLNELVDEIVENSGAEVTP